MAFIALSWAQFMTVNHLHDLNSLMAELGGSWKSWIVEAHFSHGSDTKPQQSLHLTSFHPKWRNTLSVEEQGSHEKMLGWLSMS